MSLEMGHIFTSIPTTVVWTAYFQRFGYFGIPKRHKLVQILFVLQYINAQYNDDAVS